MVCPKREQTAKYFKITTFSSINFLEGSVRLSKKEGGSGVLQMDATNKALLLKWW